MRTIFRDVVLMIDIFAMSLAVGATAWFFFIQSPILYKAMVREQFVPVQMRLSGALFTTLLVTLVAVVAAAVVHTSSFTSLSTLTAAVGLVAIAVNKFVIFPRALRAGNASNQLHESHGETGTPSEFVSDGAGETATRMHRVVVLFVLVMVAALVAHGIVTTV